MRSASIVSAFLVVGFLSLAAKAQSQNLKAVIQAENAFAAYARNYNTKDAFLKYMDSNAVMFDKGEMYNAKQVWTADTSSVGNLLWKPAFAGIAASGDLAFTAGPWEYKLSLTDTAVGSGAFATIWTKTSAGEWKFLVDLGISAYQSINNYKRVEEAGNGKKSVADTSLPRMLEENINRQVLKDGPAALVDICDQNCWYMFQGSVPLKGIREVRKKAIAITPGKLAFEPAVVKIASSGDLAYAYGYVQYNNKKENYLRIWKNTNKGWKMVLLLIK